MTNKEIIIDGGLIDCPCYINEPLYRHHQVCRVQSQVFSEQQTAEKPILKCREIENCPIKEQYKQLQREREANLRKTAECEKLKAQLETYSKMLDNPEFKTALVNVRTGEFDVWRNLGRKAERFEKALDEILEKCDNGIICLTELSYLIIKRIVNTAKDGEECE